MKLKRLLKRLLMAMLFLTTVGIAYAQGQGVATQGAAAQEPATDTTSVGASQSLDSLLVGVSIFDRLAEYNTEVNQIPQIREAFSKYIEQNSGKKRHGYRIRIFISNAQNARAQSLEVENSFKKLFPAIPTYRTPSNPYFKVTVGNYRTRSDAARALTIIKEEYPAAFMVKETIDYPEL
ncbi:MAG: SPOR domain-containing protein [Candidatus Egerieousia sp.]|nr:SPOR domain-containing protein [Candidatus Egerieousia sp.]